MRRVFYALLMVNLMFFGWHQFTKQVGDTVEASAEVPPASGVAPIRLLTEIGDDAEIELGKRTEAEKCDVYGPFFLASESKAFLTVVKKAGVKGRQEQELVKLKPYFWVYVLPQASARKAQGLVNRLRGYQVDAELIGEGRLRNGVSLGDFESKDMVDQLQQRLSKLNVLLEMKQKSRDYRQFWVLLDPGSEARIGVELRDGLIADYPGIFHQQKICKPIASG